MVEAMTEVRATHTDTHLVPPESGEAQPTDKLRPDQILMFAVVATALFMSTLDQTIVATALDSIQQGLDTTVTWVGWTITAYSLGMVMMLSLAGKLTQRYGPRRVFLASITIFSVASLACGLVTQVEPLIALRFVQAVGGAGFTPSATRIVVEHFGSHRDKAVGLFGSLFTSGAMIGPLAGGLIVSKLSWHWVFLVNVPLGLILIPLALWLIPSDRAIDRQTSAPPEPLDLPGVTFLGVGLFGAMLALSMAGDQPQGWVAIALVSTLVALGTLWQFTCHIQKVAHPVIAPRLVWGQGFAAVNLINVFYAGCGMGLMALLPWYATTRYEIDALGSGTLLAAEGVAAITLSTLGALMLRRTGYRRPLYVTAFFVVLGMIDLALPASGFTPYVWLSIAAALIGIGLGVASPASRNAGLQLVPDQAAPIAALRSSGLQVGSIAAVSIATTVISGAAEPAVAMAWVYASYAVLTIVVGLPAVRRIPEHHGSW